MIHTLVTKTETFSNYYYITCSFFSLPFQPCYSCLRNRQLSVLPSMLKTSTTYPPQMRKGSCNCLPRITKVPPPYFPLHSNFLSFLLEKYTRNTQQKTSSSSATVLGSTDPLENTMKAVDPLPQETHKCINKTWQIVSQRSQTSGSQWISVKWP